MKTLSNNTYESPNIEILNVGSMDVICTSVRNEEFTDPLNYEW